MQLRKTILASVLSAALALSAAACGTAEHTQSMSSAAASEHVAETPTPSPEATATASPTAEPTVKSTASPAPESNEVSENAEITAEIEAMAPLLEAHILAQMNGMAFDANDPGCDDGYGKRSHSDKSSLLCGKSRNARCLRGQYGGRRVRCPLLHRNEVQ